MKNKNLVHIGTFSNPLGLKGEIKIIMHTLNLDSFTSLSPYLKEDGKTHWFFSKLNFRNNKFIGKLEGYNSRNCVENLKGKKIYTLRNNLPKTKKNQFYISDLIGCKIKTLNNKLLGNIIKIDNFGAGDLINVQKHKGKSFYIPMNNENIVKIDIKKKIVQVKPIKGILD